MVKRETCLFLGKEYSGHSNIKSLKLEGIWGGQCDWKRLAGDETGNAAQDQNTGFILDVLRKKVFEWFCLEVWHNPI